MAETVADIAIGVTADIAPLMRETARAEAAIGRFDRAVKGVGSGMANFGTKAMAFGSNMAFAAAAVGAVSAAVLTLVRNAANAGEAIANSSKAAGMSTTAYQEYAYALSEAADMSGDEFADATVKLNKRLGEAMAGSEEATAALVKLGISQADIASGSVNTDTALAALVTTLENTTDPAVAAAIAAEVLGRSGARLGGMLSGTTGQTDALRESARSLGIVMSEDAVDASDDFNQAFDATVKQIDAVKNAIAGSLMPTITDVVIPEVQKAITTVGAFAEIIGEVKAAFDGVPEPVKMAIGKLMDAINPVGAAAETLGAAWTKWGEDFKAAIGGAIDFVTGKFDAFMGLIDTIVNTLREWKSTAAEFLNITPMTPEYSNPDGGADESTGQGIFGSGGSMMLPGGAGSDTLGVSMADGMVNGFVNRMAERSGEIAATVDTIPQIARDQLGIHSPSTVFADIGGNIGEGLAQGIASSAAAVAASIEGINGTAVGSTKNMVSETLGVLGQLFKGSKAIAAAQAVVNAWAGATEALKLPFPANVLAFGKVLATGLSAAQAIRGTNVGSSGSGSAGAAAAPTSQSVANITLNGDSFSRSSIEDLFRQINDGLKTGRTINLVTA